MGSNEHLFVVRIEGGGAIDLCSRERVGIMHGQILRFLSGRGAEVTGG